MEDKLCIYFCTSLLPEVFYVHKNGFYPDVVLKGFPLSCNDGIVGKEKILSILNNDLKNYSKIIVIVSSCYENINKSAHLDPKIEIVHLEQCLEIALNLQSIYHLIQQGNYLVTNGWLHNIDNHLKEWGFDDATAKIFFRESVKKILLLDTGLPGDYAQNLEKMSDYMGVPYEVFPIGMTQIKLFFHSIICKWREENNRKNLNSEIAKITKESADYFVIFSQLKQLMNQTDEGHIENEISTLLDILFMPQEIVYQRINNGSITDTLLLKKAPKENIYTSEETLEIDIVFHSEILGKFTIYGIYFSQFKMKYNPMKEVISQIAGVTIANARKYSELEKAHHEIEQSEQQLKELNATKDKFFSIVAHDLRSPFNSILGFSDLLLENIKSNNFSNALQYTQIVHDSSERVLDFITNLLDWARSETGKIILSPEMINLHDLVKDICSIQHYPALEKNIILEFHISENSMVYADKQTISLVLRNLISNAIKFTNINGNIKITSEFKDHLTRIHIQDNGVGISENRLNKLFKIEHNESTKGTGNEKGTGLGLILCKEFVEKNGGTISVESTEGLGSCFSFSCPNINASISK